MKIMRSYNGPRQKCQAQDKTDAEMYKHREEEEDVPQPILGELGPPPGPDIDLSGAFGMDRLSFLFSVFEDPTHSRLAQWRRQSNTF